MNKLTRAETLQFIKIFSDVYGIQLTVSQAEDQGSRLISLFELTFKNKSVLTGIEKTGRKTHNKDKPTDYE